MKSPLSNSRLFGWLSIELVITIIVGFGVGGVAWGKLATKVESNSLSITQIHEKQSKITDNVSEIQQDVAGIRSDTKHLNQNVSEIKEHQNDQRKLLQSISERIR